MTTRSGRSFGVGPVGDSGDLLSVSGTRPSASAAHLASSRPVESHETQLGSEVGLTATTTMESIASTVAAQMDSSVSSPSSSATRKVESNMYNFYLFLIFTRDSIARSLYATPISSVRLSGTRVYCITRKLCYRKDGRAMRPIHGAMKIFMTP